MPIIVICKLRNKMKHISIFQCKVDLSPSLSLSFARTAMSKVYLLAYNVAQTVAWSRVPERCAARRRWSGARRRATAFARMGYLMWVAQNAAILEVLHAMW
jgi:hypothetical protein